MKISAGHVKGKNERKFFLFSLSLSVLPFSLVLAAKHFFLNQKKVPHIQSERKF